MTGVHSFTGHRPEKLGGYDPAAEKRLIAFAKDILVTCRTEIAIVGMALGWDQAVADACVSLGVPFVAAVPFPGQQDRWPPQSRERWARLALAAQDTKLINERRPRNGGEAAAMLHRRNNWMVEQGSHLQALWDGDPVGGTASCVAFASARNHPFTNHWPRWTDPTRGMFEDILG